MTFAIAPEDLNTQAATLRALAGTTTTATNYANDHLSLEFHEAAALFQQARVQTDQLRDAITAYLGTLHTADIGSAQELESTAANSVALDDAVEAELDAAYPDSGVAVGLPADASANVCLALPDSALIAPATSAPTDLATEILTTNWLSPSTILSEAIGLITGLFGLDSPFDRVGKTFGGDWDRMYECGDAAQHLAAYFESQADNRRTAMATAAQTWQGEAATAATTFFARQGETLDEAAQKLRDTSPEFEAVVRGMNSAGNLASGLMATIIDASLIAWGCYVAGGATAWTGVGAIIGGICGTGAVGVAVYALYELFTLCQNVLSALDALTVLIGFAVSFTVGAGQLPQVTAYDNAQV